MFAQPLARPLAGPLARSIAAGGVGFVGILDLYPNAAAAYSPRVLSSEWLTEPVVRVRRSSDNAEQDFTATQITDGTLLTFTGAGDGFVTIWYDQSGNTNDAPQIAATSQPKIVSSGVLVSSGLDFDGVDDNLNLAAFTGGAIAQPFSSFIVAKSDVLDANQKIIAGFLNVFVGTSDAAEGRYNLRGGGTILTGSQISDTNTKLFTALFNTTDTLFVNGASEVSGDSGSNSLTSLRIGEQDNGFNQFNGIISEVIIYPSDQASNRVAIETNINDYYGIY